MIPNLPPPDPAAPSAPLDTEAPAAPQVLAELMNPSPSKQRDLEVDALRLMHEYLADRDEPCPACKYNLRNLRGDACPECGWQLRLRVTTVEPALTAWVVTVVSLCIGAGLGIPSAIAIFMGALGEMSRAGGDARQLFIAFALILFALCIPLSLFTILNRRLFLKMKQETQYFIALLSCGAVSLTILVVIAIVFGGRF